MLVIRKKLVPQGEARAPEPHSAEKGQFPHDAGAHRLYHLCDGNKESALLPGSGPVKIEADFWGEREKENLQLREHFSASMASTTIRAQRASRSYSVSMV